MPNYTSNYKLTKPTPNELYNIDIQNNNMDNVDTNLKKVSDVANEANSRSKTNESNLEALKTFQEDPFEETGKVVQVDLFQDAPLNVISHIEPIQSGSGDPYPGGGGKNLLPNTAKTQTVNGVTFTVNADGSITANGTATGTVTYNIGFPVLMAGSYVISGGVSGVSVILRRKKADGTYGYTSTQNSTETQVVLDGTENELYVYAQISSGVTVSGATLKPMIRLASITDSTYTPYSNIRPISGHTGAKLTKCGKNLISRPYIDASKTENGITIKVNDDGSISANGTPNAQTRFTLVDKFTLLPGTYTLSGIDKATTGHVDIQVFDPSYNLLAYVNNYGKTTNTFTITEATAVKINIYFGAGNAAEWTWIRPQLELGSVATSYEPYRGANTYVMDFGRNLAKSIHATGYTSIYSNCLYVDADFKPNTTYTISFIANAENADMVLYLSETLVSYKELRITGARQSVTFTTKESMSSKPVDGKGHIMFKNGTELAAPMTFTDVQLELGSTATDYAPYNSTLLAQTGGMVYGGTMDWNTGVLTVNRVLSSFNGSETWQMNTGTTEDNLFFLRLHDNLPSTNAHTMCSHLPATQTSPENGLGCFVSATYSVIYINLGMTHTIDTFKAYLVDQYSAGTPVQITYKLTEPITIQLTPHELSALAGCNTLYSNCGDTTVSGRKDIIWLTHSLIKRIEALEAQAAGL